MNKVVLNMSIRGIDGNIMINRALERMPEQVRQVKAEEQNQAALAQIGREQSEQELNRPTGTEKIEGAGLRVTKDPEKDSRMNKRKEKQKRDDSGENEKPENEDLLLRPVSNPKNKPAGHRIDISI